MTGPFDGRRLTLARLYSGLTKTSLAKEVGVSPAAVTQYELGRTRPSSKTLAALSLRLGFPLSFFSAAAPPLDFSEEHTHFRRLRATTKMQRAQLLARLELLAEVVGVVEEYVDFPALDLPDLHVYCSTGSFEQAALVLRGQWALGQGPLEHVVRLLETRGTIVTRRAVDTRGVDAFSRWFGSRPMVVLASDKEDRERSRFDAAHELAHLVLHHDAEPGRQAVEREAHAFAAAFLMPAEVLRAELPRRLNWDRLFHLKQRWGVSLAALLHRAYTLKVFSPDAYQRARVRLALNGWLEVEPYRTGPPEEPMLLERALQLMRDRAGVDTDTLARRLSLPLSVLTGLLGDAEPKRLPLAL